MGRELNQEVSRVIDLLGPRNLAFESATCTVAEYESLRHALPTVSMVAVSGWVEVLRRVKDEVEISEIREAVRSAERAFTMVRAGLRIGDTEKDVADALDASMRRCGATESSFPHDRRGGGSGGIAPRPTDDNHSNRRR